MIEKPDKAIATSIKAKLEEKKFLKDTHSATIVAKLSAGNITEEEWKLMADLSLESEEG